MNLEEFLLCFHVGLPEPEDQQPGSRMSDGCRFLWSADLLCIKSCLFKQMGSQWGAAHPRCSLCFCVQFTVRVFSLFEGAIVKLQQAGLQKVALPLQGAPVRSTASEMTH